MDESSGTGPDFIPAKILKLFAEQLAYPVLMMATLILNSGEWPEDWRVHWIVPLYKRGAVYLSKNYRGIHLTAQLSKVLERLFLSILTPHIKLWNLTGINQFAYTKEGLKRCPCFIMFTMGESVGERVQSIGLLL